MIMMDCDIHKIEIYTKTRGSIKETVVWREWDKKACQGPDGHGGERQRRHSQGHRGMKDLHIFRKQQVLPHTVQWG